MTRRNELAEDRALSYEKTLERLYELIFSGASILFFIAIYYLIDRFLTYPPMRSFWDKYEDFLLLVLLVISCLFNNLLDHLLIKLKHLSDEEVASCRLIGMLYMLLIFAYVKWIYLDDNYDKFIIYFLGLMIGRFVYFDASLRGFRESIRMAAKNIYLMLIALAYVALMALVGFRTDYLLIHNGVIVNVFIAHLFMCGAIAIFHRTVVKWILNKLSCLED